MLSTHQAVEDLHTRTEGAVRSRHCMKKLRIEGGNFPIPSLERGATEVQVPNPTCPLDVTRSNRVGVYATRYGCGHSIWVTPETETVTVTAETESDSRVRTLKPAVITMSR